MNLIRGFSEPIIYNKERSQDKEEFESNKYKVVAVRSHQQRTFPRDAEEIEQTINTYVKRGWRFVQMECSDNEYERLVYLVFSKNK